MSSVICGTDLLVGTACDAAALRDLLAETLPVRRDDVFLAEAVDTEPGNFLAALGSRNVVKLHVLRRLPPSKGAFDFKVDLEFVEPLLSRSLQSLADAGPCTVALSRQTAFPEEIGLPVGEGYVIFQPGQPPRSGAIDESGPDDDPVWHWVPTDDPLPPLPP